MKYQVVNPATGQLEKEYPTATDAEIGEILDRAGRGSKAWRKTAMSERADILRQVAELYKERSAELASIITREMGKPTREARGELKFVVAIYRYYAENGADLLKDEPLKSRRRVRPSSASRRSARCSASCRGTTRTTRSLDSRPPTS